MLRFPGRDVGRREAIIAVGRDRRADVNDDGRTYKLVDRDLVDRLLPLGEVDLRIEVRAAMFARRVAPGCI